MELISGRHCIANVRTAVRLLTRDVTEHVESCKYARHCKKPFMDLHTLPRRNVWKLFKLQLSAGIFSNHNRHWIVFGRNNFDHVANRQKLCQWFVDFDLYVRQLRAWELLSTNQPVTITELSSACRRWFYGTAADARLGRIYTQLLSCCSVLCQANRGKESFAVDINF